MQGVIAKAKKLPKQQPEFKAEVEAFEERLLATAVERKEEEATTEVLCLCPQSYTRQSSNAVARGAAMPLLYIHYFSSPSACHLPVHLHMEAFRFTSHLRPCLAQSIICLAFRLPQTGRNTATDT